MFKKKEKFLFLNLLIISDIITIIICFLVSYWIRFVLEVLPVTKGVPPLAEYIKMLPLVTLIWLWIFRRFGLYDTRRKISSIDQSFIIFKAVSLGTFSIMAITFLYRDFSYSRLVIVYNWIISLFMIIGTRTLLKSVHLWMFQHGVEVRRTLIVGANNTAKTLIRKIKKYNLDYQIIGLIDNNTEVEGYDFEGIKILGPLDSIGLYAKGKNINEIIFTLPSSLHERIFEIIRQCDGLDINFSMVPDFYEILKGKTSIGEIHGIPLIGLKEVSLNDFDRVVKRVLDIIFSFIFLLLFSPLFVIFAIIIKMECPGSVFFRQKRVGMDRKNFILYKFRSMRQSTKNKAARVWTKQDDPRRTKFGAFLRRWSFDELPQLWNVLRGDMSLVGPRPERPHFVREFKSRIPNYMERHKVKSGITGWSQINGLRGDTSIEERTKYDLYYIENWSLWFDLKIVLMTIFSIGKGAY